jgi:threonine synthase
VTSFITHLECSRCARVYEAGRPQTLCACQGPLLARYDLRAAAAAFPREAVARGPASLWRYRPLLPPRRDESIVTLGEGFTPMVRATRLGERFGAPRLFIKDEGLNPTATFKARGFASAVTMAREFGLARLAAPSAGNAASALAAYAAAAGLEAHIFMPADVPQANLAECRAFGARVTLVNGLISDCARMVAERAPAEGWFDMSTMKEPYRVEGKKTMGYEVAEQLGWKLPDAIFYPTGGGVGLIGMWKAFEELEQLGWVETGRRPKMIAVQAEGCCPVVRAFERGAPKAEFFEGAHTLAAGLRVPKPLADSLILDYVRASGGTCVAVSDEEILRGVFELAATEGIFAAPEGAACLPAYRRLLESGFLKPDDTAVLFNTGSGLKYLDVLSPRKTAGTEENIGGLITPF